MCIRDRSFRQQWGWRRPCYFIRKILVSSLCTVISANHTDDSRPKSRLWDLMSESKCARHQYKWLTTAVTPYDNRLWQKNMTQNSVVNWLNQIISSWFYDIALSRKQICVPRIIIILMIIDIFLKRWIPLWTTYMRLKTNKQKTKQTTTTRNKQNPPT